MSDHTFSVQPDGDLTPSQALPPDSVAKLPGLSDPERWVELHGDYLFKYALMRLRDPAKAEDAVQETFLAALKGGKCFAGRSAEKSWLMRTGPASAMAVEAPIRLAREIRDMQ